MARTLSQTFLARQHPVTNGALPVTKGGPVGTKIALSLPTAVDAVVA
jgi:hypothetical protein